MNAKEISDATLESVTPADDDLMILYDVSEGTTGKATIADIAPKVAENIDSEKLPSVAALYLGDMSTEKYVRQDETTIGQVSFADDYIIPKSGGYIIRCEINNISAGVAANSISVKIDNKEILVIGNTSSAPWTAITDSIYIPLKQGASVNFVGNFSIAGFRYNYSVKKVF